MLGHDIAAALPELRAQAESMMVDTCRVRRLDTDTPSVPDPDTLALVPNYLADDIYAGPCRIQRPGALSPREQVSGGFEFDVRAVIAQLPLSATDIASGDHVEVTAIGPLTDPDLMGLVATVQANLAKTHPTKRTLVCQEVS